jgi:hypothetical protein
MENTNPNNTELNENNPVALDKEQVEILIKRLEIQRNTAYSQIFCFRTNIYTINR